MIAEAARLIEARGLAKGCWEDPDTGALCIHGALNVAAGQPADALAAEPLSDERLGASMTVLRFAFEQFPDRKWVGGIAGFNDHPLTTDQDAVLVLEKAALHAEELAQRRTVVTHFGGEAA